MSHLAQVREEPLREYVRGRDFKNYLWCRKGRVDKDGYEIGGQDWIWVYFAHYDKYLAQCLAFRCAQK